jgi:LacI family transcriptional regulator
MKVKAGLKSVAAAAGVSVATVSRALDPLKSKRISSGTLQRVLNACEKVDYKTNSWARRLKRQRNEMLSFVLPRNIFYPQPCEFGGSGYPFMKIIEGMTEEARKWRYDIKIVPVPDPSCQTAVSEICGAGNFDGVILFGLTELENIRSGLLDREIPHAAISTYRLDTEGLTEFSADSGTGVFQAVKHLLGKGHSRIAFLHNSNTGLKTRAPAGWQRFSGYLEAMTEAGLYSGDMIFQTATVIELKKWLSGFDGEFPFSAVVCVNDAMARNLINELAALDVSVPGDIAVTGYDNDPNFTGGEPELSSVDTHLKELGIESVRALIQSLEYRQPLGRGQMIRSTFIERGSA